MNEGQAFGSGNVFADLGLSDPEERLAKADLASNIATAIDVRGAGRAEAATISGLSEDEVALVLHGRLEGIGTERLTQALARLDPFTSDR